ncbi:hypothetical protein BJ508DRAFT_323064 [Ascobolus immersus RN42]|uniref:Uncharacterized protein n=1 Tax=Ascobolus immersus RN42 TaxID=1160509 RepID=A0A3N4IL60_ASCIM|nr:hypothetical protein BJ508DRAFT_323064 [Ascobolus immersus RN42]
MAPRAVIPYDPPRRNFAKVIPYDHAYPAVDEIEDLLRAFKAVINEPSDAAETSHRFCSLENVEKIDVEGIFSSEHVTDEVKKLIEDVAKRLEQREILMRPSYEDLLLALKSLRNVFFKWTYSERQVLKGAGQDYYDMAVSRSNIYHAIFALGVALMDSYYTLFRLYHSGTGPAPPQLGERAWPTKDQPEALKAIHGLKLHSNFYTATVSPLLEIYTYKSLTDHADFVQRARDYAAIAFGHVLLFSACTTGVNDTIEAVRSRKKDWLTQLGDLKDFVVELGTTLKLELPELKNYINAIGDVENDQLEILLRTRGLFPYLRGQVNRDAAPPLEIPLPSLQAEFLIRFVRGRVTHYKTDLPMPMSSLEVFVGKLTLKLAAPLPERPPAAATS